jgi:hypothetical protein
MQEKKEDYKEKLRENLIKLCVIKINNKKEDNRMMKFSQFSKVCFDNNNLTKNI